MTEEQLYARVTWRLLPMLFLFYVAAYLDRLNVGFAKLQMLAQLGWSETIYGMGAGMFFLGYFVLQVPSNLLVHRVGVRRSIAVMMLAWGALSAAQMLVRTPAEFYVLRFALGLAESGFYPAIIFYLTLWFPAARRGRATAFFWTSIPTAGMVGGPLSGWIMSACAGAHGLAGWQWLFVLEGVPSMALGLLVWFVLDDSIAQAKWLDLEEKRILERNVSTEYQPTGELTLGRVLCSGPVWLLAVIYFFFMTGLYGISFWLPQLIRSSGVEAPWQIGLLSAIPYAVAVVAMLVIGRHSDLTGERNWHIALSILVGAAGLVLSGILGHTTTAALAVLTVATAGLLAGLPLFWSLPQQILSGRAAAAGIALINAVGCLAGFASPYALGAIKDATHSLAIGLYAIAACIAAGAGLVLLRGQPARVSPGPTT